MTSKPLVSLYIKADYGNIFIVCRLAILQKSAFRTSHQTSSVICLLQQRTQDTEHGSGDPVGGNRAWEKWR
jgi:hypothetical protein